MAEDFIQVAPDSTGKKVRNLKMTVLQPDGTTSDVYCQVVAMIDESGNPINLSDPFEELIDAVQRIERLLMAIFDTELD